MSDVATAAPERPYKGLRPFEATAVDALLFFGRGRERELIAANLIASRLTILYGESGVGKSSVLRAGVVQMLRQQARAGAGFAVALYSGWSERDPIEGMVDAARDAVAELLGHDPGRGTGKLAERLAWLSDLAGGDLYLVLDQVDEYFLYHGADGGPLLAELPALVTEPGLGVNVLLGIREESLARLDVFKARIPALFANSLRLERLDREAGRAAIVGPLEAWSQLAGATPVDIEPAVVDAILASVTVTAGNGNGAVAGAAIEPPYLQVVMERLWDAERAAGSNVLRLATLEALGGGRRIVSEHLDRALAGLGPAEQDTAAAMFSHLVTPSGAKVAYDVADLAGYASADEAEVRNVADTLVAERILRPVTGHGAGGRVEIYHDVLASAAAEWRRRHDADRALQAEREAARRRHRRLLVVAVVALLALAAMTAVAVYAIVQQENANDARGDANAREQAARALVALPTDPVEALTGAVAAARDSSSPAVADILRTVLLGVSQTGRYGDRKTPVSGAALLGRRVVVGDELGRVTVYRRDGTVETSLRDPGPVGALTTSPDGLLLVAAGPQVSLSQAAAGRCCRVIRALRFEAPVRAAVFEEGAAPARFAVASGHTVGVWSRTGRLVWRRQVRGVPRLLSLGERRLLVATPLRAWLLNAANGARVATLDFKHAIPLKAAAYSETLGLVATGHTNTDGTLLWDARTGRLLDRLHGHEGPVIAVAFAPSGKPALATASTDGTARVWSPSRAPGRTALMSTLNGHTLPLLSVAFGSGDTLLTTSTDRTARVWARDGQALAVLAGHSQPVAGGELRGPTALTWGADGTARTWAWSTTPTVRHVASFTGPVTAAAVAGSLEAGVVGVSAELITGRRQPVSLLESTLGAVQALGVSADGSAAATGGKGGAVIWARSGRERAYYWKGAGSMVALSADGRLLVTGGGGGSLQVSGGKGRSRTMATGLGTVVAGAVSPDGRYVGAGDATGAAGVWELATGKLVSRLTGHRDVVTGMAFSADSQLVGTASRDHDARVWRVADGSLVQRLSHVAVVGGLAFSPDGRWVATAGPQRANVWDVATGNPLVKVAGSDGKVRFVAVAFSADGRALRTVESDGAVGTYRCVVCGTVDDVRSAAEARLRRLTAVRRAR